MYTPSTETLQKYADVMVNFALGFTKGVKKDDVVLIQYYTPAKPLALEVYKMLLVQEAHPILKNYDFEFEKAFYEFANPTQLEFFPNKYTKGMIDTIDHRIFLLADEEPLFLKNINPKKLMQANKSKRLYRKWLNEKEDKGKLSWTLCLYGTPAMAHEAGISLEAYWQQIEKACFLDQSDPVNQWRSVQSQMTNTIEKLNSLDIDKIRITAKGTDLTLQLGEKRRFIGGRGANIPSFEIFTSPDWRGTNGHIFLDYPLYRYGNIIKDIYLEFKEGKIVKATAAQNENLLHEMIAQENADKIGEFSLTDKRFSKIDSFMAETLFDENYGGSYGNTHIAIGSSYHDTYTGDPLVMKDADWVKLGYNESTEHCDMISTTRRTVEITTKNGDVKVIYKDGEFKL